MRKRENFVKFEEELATLGKQNKSLITENATLKAEKKML